MGEGIFRMWCANSGLIANPSDIDRTGWDFYLEEDSPLSSISSEIHAPNLEFKVQVKSTDSTNKRVQVKLSNLRRLATAPSPAFFIFIEFDGSPKAQRAYLRHVDKELITKILERSHNNSQAKKPKEENRIHMTISYDESHRMPDLNEAFLKPALLTHTGTDLTKYIQEKKLHLESAGYEEDSFTFKFTTPNLESLSKLIDASLGIQKDVEVINVHGSRKRFNTTEQIPALQSQSAVLSFPDVKPSHEGQITLFHDKLSAGMSLKCEVFSSPMNILSPKKYQKIRIHTQPFDILSNPHTGKSEITVNVDDDTTLEVRVFRKYLKFLQEIFQNPAQKSLHIDLTGMPTIRLTFTSKPKEDFNFSRPIKTLGYIIDILRNFDIDEDVLISHRSIYDNHNPIAVLHYLLKETHENFTLKFKAHDSIQPLDGTITIIHFTSARIGNFVFGVFYSLTGTVIPTEEDHTYDHTPTRVKIERKIACAADKDIDGDLLSRELELIKSRLDAPNTTTLILNFEFEEQNA